MAQRLQRALLSLPEVDLRVGWIRDQLGRLPLERAAQELNALCEDSERSVPEAREALLAVAIFVVGSADSPLLEALRAHAVAKGQLGLGRLLRARPEKKSRKKRAPEELPVPDYGAGRELTVGERRSLARRPNRRSFEKLLSDPHPLVIRQLLGNPKLTEDDVIRLATRRPARSEVMAQLAQSPRWLRRPRVRLSILLNPGAPSTMALPLLGLCTRGELRIVVESTEASPLLRSTARELVERRPPIDVVNPQAPLQ